MPPLNLESQPDDEDERPQPEFLHPAPKPSESLEQQEDDDRTLCRDLDPFDTLRRQLTILGFERGEYSGIPVPLEGIPLVVEPSYPFAKAFDQVNEITNPSKEGPHWSDAYEVVNTFYSTHKRCDIVVIRHKRTGMTEYRLRPAMNHATELIATLYASDVWGVDQEQAALQTLGRMLRHRQFKQYLLTGMFMERSPRSHVSYIFRRLRPTLAIAAIREENIDKDTPASMLCALCMHPIAYYAGSWAGAMCPTDDVIAHLALMRGDEHMFWKRANQHPVHRPGAGI